MVNKYYLKIQICFILILLFGVGLSANSINEESKKILENHFKSLGGVEFLKSLHNSSVNLESGPPYITNITLTSNQNGDLKLEFGEHGLTEEVINIKGGKSTSKGFIEARKLKEMDVANYQVLSTLFNNGFSLYKLRNNLKYEGIKKYGPEKLHEFSVTDDKYKLNIFIDNSEYKIRRLIVDNNREGLENYSIIYEFFDFKKSGKMLYPSKYYISDLGKGSDFEFGGDYFVRGIEFNKKLSKDYFSKTELNFGSVSVEERQLSANIVSFTWFEDPGQAVIYSNLTEADFKKAGLKPGEKYLIDFLGAKQLFTYVPNQSDIKPEMTGAGKAIATNSQRIKYTVFLFYGKTFKDVIEKIKPLTKIGISENK